MFWRSKKRPNPPPADHEEEFVEWLLHYGKEFEVYRKIYKADLEKYVALNKREVMKELANYSDKDQLSDRLGKMSVFYQENCMPSVQKARGVMFLDPINQAVVAGIEIKIAIFHYVLKYKYKDMLTVLSEDICGPLEDIYNSS